jgi:potassium-transporting ATPase KdpC subunit
MSEQAVSIRPHVGLTRPVVVSAVFFMLLTGLAYPLFTTLLANVVFPFQSRGSLIERNGVLVGSSVVGQNFTRPEYFHPRPSVTMGPDPADASKTVSAPYNAGLSGASNQGATNQKLIDDVKARVDAYRTENGLAADALVPVDAVTASASGLDPHISVANARIQAERVARQRRLSQEEVLRLVEAHTSGRLLGLFGEPRINVLELNLALDAVPGAAK